MLRTSSLQYLNRCQSCCYSQKWRWHSWARSSAAPCGFRLWRFAMRARAAGSEGTIAGGERMSMAPESGQTGKHVRDVSAPLREVRMRVFCVVCSLSYAQVFACLMCRVCLCYVFVATARPSATGGRFAPTGLACEAITSLSCCSESASALSNNGYLKGIAIKRLLGA